MKSGNARFCPASFCGYSSVHFRMNHATGFKSAAVTSQPSLIASRGIAPPPANGMNFVIVLDGPSGAGKSSTARAVAARLGILFLDTGALYRAVALRALQNGVSPDDTAAVGRCAAAARLDLTG